MRLRALNTRPAHPQGEFVLYWMTAARRPFYNYGLQRAVELAVRWGRPLVVLEALRCGYPWASPRLHRFVIDGMLANREHFARTGARYYPYLEDRPGAGSGLVETLAARACAVVGDDFPCFFLPRMQAAVAERLPVVFETVDSNGLLPMRAASQVYARAVDFRRFLQKTLPEHLEQPPARDPLHGVRLPALELSLERWPELGEVELDALPLDPRAQPVALRGGFVEGSAIVERFRAGHSGLSPYLHFGHVSPHEILPTLGWKPSLLGQTARGQREGWWGLEPALEAFLDQLVTWRELGFNMCWQRQDYDRYESLPGWALKTLAEHAGDPREHLYPLARLEAAETGDPVWNAAQRQLLTEGTIHSYVRMLWGKKILEWTRSPQEALEFMIELNNRYALDGRDPNSYSGIFWVLGRYDRPWFERPIYGTVRYMSSECTRRKIKGYVK